VSIVSSVLLLVAIYLVTKDLMGPDRALAVTAVLSVDPTLLSTTRDMMPETLAVLFFVLTMWGIVRGIDDDRYMVWAGLCAAAGYLAKSSVGYLFIVAGAAGFVWRFAYIRWDVLKRRYYLAAIALFLGICGTWALRNIAAFGWPNWSTSPYLDASLTNALHHGGEFVWAFVVTVPFFAVIILSYGVYWLPWLRRSLSRWKQPRTSALWLAVGLVLIISLWFSASLVIWEGTPLLLHPAMRFRYLVLAFPVLMWAAMDEVELGSIDAPLTRRVVPAFLQEAWRTARAGGRWRYVRPVLIVVFIAIAPWLASLTRFYLVAAVPLAAGSVAMLLTDARKVLAVMLAVMLVVGVELMTERAQVPEVDLVHDLAGRVAPGEAVALDGREYRIGYLYAELEDDDVALVRYTHNSTERWLITYDLGASYPDHTLVRVYEHRDSPGVFTLAARSLLGGEEVTARDTVALWERT
jgi:4-amino-4-deoxy-L-arabinose transferase-like glycosyltransferase